MSGIVVDHPVILIRLSQAEFQALPSFNCAIGLTFKG